MSAIRALRRTTLLSNQLRYTPQSALLATSSSTSPALLSNTSSHIQSRRMGVYAADTPARVKDAKGLHLITMSTPNGQKVQIMLEELADLYGVAWTTSKINIMTNIQKEDWFLRIDPNGRIPVLVDNTVSPPFPVMETSAELLYLATKYDHSNKLSFSDALEQNEMIQWLFFWHGSGAPYQGQANHFFKFAKVKDAYPQERFKNETLRVFGVLEIRLSGKYNNGETRDYLAGSGKGKYSVADIGTWPWVKGWEFSGAFNKQEMQEFPNVLKWIDRIAEREAVKRGTGEKYSGNDFEQK